MEVKVKLQMDEVEGRDIRIQKAPEQLHKKLERLISKVGYETGEDITKPDLCIQLLSTHPRIKSLKKI